MSTSSKKITLEDRYAISTNFEHLQKKYKGTGHADISKEEWLRNVRKDQQSHIVLQPSLMSFVSIAQNMSSEEVRIKLLTDIGTNKNPQNK
eukprot:TRINITY_DN437_c0_g1_i1.p1 TRINITY_DN437_c0_g1~~TRINITY_DN437_c0_g1_i1.p1  ORF type:complete len:91 (-),score=27.78 TRINITY_DN437_c0_g1_i1:269-541(-)